MCITSWCTWCLSFCHPQVTYMSPTSSLLRCILSYFDSGSVPAFFSPLEKSAPFLTMFFFLSSPLPSSVPPNKNLCLLHCSSPSEIFFCEKVKKKPGYGLELTFLSCKDQFLALALVHGSQEKISVGTNCSIREQVDMRFSLKCAWWDLVYLLCRGSSQTVSVLDGRGRQKVVDSLLRAAVSLLTTSHTTSHKSPSPPHRVFHSQIYFTKHFYYSQTFKKC